MNGFTVTLSAKALKRQWEDILQRSSSGQNLAVHAPPETWNALDEHAGVRIEPATANPSDENPLVAQPYTDGTTQDGENVTLARPGIIVSSGSYATTQKAIYFNGYPAALELKNGSGSIALLAHDSAKTPPSRTLRAWLSALTGTSSEHSASTPHTSEPIKTVVAASEQWADILSVLPAGELDDESLVTAAGKAAKHLPEDVYDALIEFADHSNSNGALLLKNVPLGDIGPTPAKPSGSGKGDQVSERILLTVARLLGQPVGYLPEHNGELVQNVSPTQEGALKQVSTSSAVTLAYHTEAAFHPHQPRYLLLLCLRGDPQAATTLCPVDALIARLDEETLEELRKPLYTTGIDESYTGVRSQARSKPRAVLGGSVLQPTLWLDVDLMEGLTPEAQRALETIGRLTTRCGTEVILEGGDLLIVDNHRSVHGRSPFQPRYDGTDRWLQRAMVIADHTQANADRNGRIINTRFVS